MASVRLSYIALLDKALKMEAYSGPPFTKADSNFFLAWNLAVMAYLVLKYELIYFALANGKFKVSHLLIAPFPLSLTPGCHLLPQFIG